MLNWANQFNICTFLDNHHYASHHSSVECLLATGVVRSFSISNNVTVLPELKAFLHNNDDWLFGHIGYDFGNNIPAGTTANKQDGIGFEDIFLFQPEIVLQLSALEVTISSLTVLPEKIFQDIYYTQPVPLSATATSNLTIHARITKEAYLQTIQQLRQHILRGDCYEINFCQEFYAENAMVDTLYLYNRLTQVSPNPFACYYKLNHRHLLCASPERYIRKTGNHIVSQPIKGTHKRNLLNMEADVQLQQQLYNSAKDRSENVMVVDLVRNDLSKICKEGSVQVEELFGIYTFPQVHQMISSIAGELKDGMDLSDVLEATFPMGSMTGAPKKRVMELIAQYEKTKRGLYSGTVGYITPDNDFDFNVVIRSILYNAESRYLSYQVGGGITYNSVAEEEYEECLLKASAIEKVLNG